MGKCNGQGSGEGLVTTAAALAITISQNRTADELDALAGFFTALGDNLALLALKAPNDCK